MRIEKSPVKGKKWRAIFNDGKHTDFGDKEYEDFTQHHDIKRRKAYWLRHASDLETQDPTRAGFLSLYILWTLPTIEAAVKQYKELFGV
jgi:predicted dienelactone hydrolase